MLNAITQFLRARRQRKFDACLDQEIFSRVFPQIRGERDFGYPFQDDSGMKTATDEMKPDKTLQNLENLISRMPRAYGLAFRYLLYRDLTETLETFERAGRHRFQPKSCDARYVATRAG